MQDKIEKRIKKDAKKLAKFKDKYKGQRCFIIGNGPSLRMEDLDKLHEKKEVCFGSHRIYLAFSKTKWRPCFYTIQDTKIMNEYFHETEKLKIKHKFAAYPFKVRQNYRIYKSFLATHMILTPFFPYCPDFSKDLTMGVYEGWTVSYFNIQLAAYMGFKQIYLIGVDHHYSKVKSSTGSIIVNDVSDSFTDEYVKANENRNLPEIEKSILGYIKAEIFSHYHGFRIYNATRGGKLEVFERINFDNLFMKSE